MANFPTSPSEGQTAVGGDGLTYVYKGGIWKSAADSTPDASQVSITPVASIAATDLQAAVQELSTEKAETATTITAGPGLSGGGDLTADRALEVDINSLPLGGTIDQAADSLAVYDASVGNNVKATISTITGGLTGSVPIGTIV